MGGRILTFTRDHPWPLLTGLLLAVYVATYSRVASVDAYYYFENLDGGPLESLCHPHHLAYLLVGKGWLLLWQVLGYTGPAMWPLKQMSLFGALGVLVVNGRLLSRLFPGGGLRASLLFLILGVSYLPWHYATEGEPVIFFQFFSLLILYLLVKAVTLEAPTRGLAWQLGVAVGLGTLFHQALVFAVPLAVVVLWQRAVPTARMALLWRFLWSTALLVGVPYLGLGYLVTQSPDPRGLILWATGYLEEFSGTYGGIHNLNPQLILTGMASAFLGGSALKPYMYGGQPLDAVFLLAVSVQVVVMALLGLGVAAMIPHWRGLEPPQRRPWRVVIAFSLLFLVAAIYWEPGSRKFWAPIQPGLVLLAGAGLMGLRRCGPRIIQNTRLSDVALGLLFLALLSGNLFGGILHKHRTRDDQQPLVRDLKAVFKPGDLLVMQADRQWQSVAYNFPEIRTVGVFAYVNPAWAAADTTLDYSARALWETLRSGGTGYVSSQVEDAVWWRIVAFNGGDGRIGRTFVLEFSDSEQALQSSRLMAWRYLSTGADF